MKKHKDYDKIKELRDLGYTYKKIGEVFGKTSFSIWQSFNWEKVYPERKRKQEEELSEYRKEREVKKALRDKETIDMLAMRSQGYSVTNIGKKYGRSCQYIYNRLNAVRRNRKAG